MTKIKKKKKKSERMWRVMAVELKQISFKYSADIKMLIMVFLLYLLNWLLNAYTIGHYNPSVSVMT